MSSSCFKCDFKKRDFTIVGKSDTVCNGFSSLIDIDFCFSVGVIWSSQRSVDSELLVFDIAIDKSEIGAVEFSFSDFVL